MRSVYIKAEFEPYEDPSFELNSFVVPEGLPDWVNPASVPDDPTYAVEVLHRRRVNDVARKLFETLEPTNSLQDDYPLQLRHRMRSFFDHILGRSGASCIRPDVVSQQSLPRNSPRGEELLGEHTSLIPLHERVSDASRRQEIDKRAENMRLKVELDALVVVMLCLPATLTSITFEAHRRGSKDVKRNAFALRVAKMTIEIFGDRIQEFAMVTSPSQRQRAAQGLSRHADFDMESAVLSSSVLDRFDVLHTLALSDHPDPDNTMRRFSISEEQVQWQSLGSTLAHLDLRNLESDSHNLPQFIKSFEHLRLLTLKNVMLVNGTQAPPQAALRRDVGPTLWLSVLIGIRRHMPSLEIHLHELRWSRDSTYLPRSAIHWLNLNAVPTGCSIDFERETRLKEDFETFLLLWNAEDSERGDQAREARKDGSLVDAAMVSRWKTYAHLRH